MKLKSLLVLLFSLALSSSAQSANILLVWEPPNATLIEHVRLLKYNIYSGLDGGPITNLVATTTNQNYTITNMVPGNYNLVVRAINVWGNESVPSNVLTLPAYVAPGAPIALRGTFQGTYTIEIK